MNKNKIKEGLEMDMTTYNKVKGTLDPKQPVKITGDKPDTSQSMVTQMEEEVKPDAIIEPKDSETIKYLSNVKDKETGEISKPFTIADKRYQMVRGVKPSKEVVMGVYCLDDFNEEGENKIHSLEYFEKNIAIPMKETLGMVGANIGVVNDGEEKEYHDKDRLMNYLNLTDIEPQYKHFFVNTKTGEITAKFKNTKEMIKSGIKLNPDEDYMDIRGLKRYRFGDSFKKDVSEANLSPEYAGTDVDKLQADVKKLANLIKNKFSLYLSKLDKPIEQAQFLTAMAAEIGVPLNKLNTIISSYRDISKQEPVATQIKESKVITKKYLEETLKQKK